MTSERQVPLIGFATGPSFHITTHLGWGVRWASAAWVAQSNSCIFYHGTHFFYVPSSIQGMDIVDNVHRYQPTVPDLQGHDPASRCSAPMMLCPSLHSRITALPLFELLSMCSNLNKDINGKDCSPCMGFSWIIMGGDILKVGVI